MLQCSSFKFIGVQRTLGNSHSKVTTIYSWPTTLNIALASGTNTYLIGHAPPYILIDTGEGNPGYIAHLSSYFQSSLLQSQCPISDIIITHKHADHHGGLIDVLDHVSSLRISPSQPWCPPRIHIHPLPSGVADSSLTDTISRLKHGEYTPPSSGSPLFPLADGTKLRTTDGSAELEIIHTPGHTADSISLILYSLDEISRPVPEGLFTADTVLGTGTAVFEDLSSYMSSLRRLTGLQIWTHPISIHPGHGPTVAPDSAKAHIDTYISHRQARENQILDVLKKYEGKASVRHIVEWLYVEYPRTLWPAAAHGVGLHLRKLEMDGKVKRLREAESRSSVSQYDGVKMEQVGEAGMEIEWELVEARFAAST